MAFTHPLRVEFNHCDPAGIVFYPRYFEMLNSTVENFFRTGVGYPFEAMMAAGEGVPTARTEVNFHAPSRLGEVLDWRLAVARLGRASVDFRVTVVAGDSHRLTADLTLVFVRLGRPQGWRDDLRAKLAAHAEDT
jgi:4-hydroxybenzoyl-CoA thioesterase